MKATTWICVIILLVLPSCIIPADVTYKGLKPIYPEAGSPLHPKRVDSLQPIFKWQAAGEPKATYDFIIYDVIKDEDIWFGGIAGGAKRSLGREVYYREGIRENEHMIEVKLKPDTEYFWTVRVRLEEPITDWSRYDYHDVLFDGSILTVTNYPYIFKTPDK